MNTPTPARHASVQETLSRQALGLAALILTVGAGHLVSRGAVVERAVEAAAAVDLADEAEDTTQESSAATLAEIKAHIEEAAARYRVSPRLVAAIIAVESEFDPHAVSRRGAQGLMQLMPATAASLDVQDSFDVRANIEGGVRHLRRLLDRFHGDLPLALAAYNAGEQAVLAHRGIPPYRETRQYVIRILYRVDREAAKGVVRRLNAPPRVTRGPQATSVPMRVTRGPEVTPVPMRVSFVEPPAMPVSASDEGVQAERTTGLSATLARLRRTIREGEPTVLPETARERQPQSP